MTQLPKQGQLKSMTPDQRTQQLVDEIVEQTIRACIITVRLQTQNLYYSAPVDQTGIRLIKELEKMRGDYVITAVPIELDSKKPTN